MTIAVSVPEGAKGDYRIEQFEITEEEAGFANIRAMWRPLERVEPGKYKRLMRGNTVVMSNTPMEVSTNRPIIRAARGRVLINGLGLGMVLTAILENANVEEVWVVEKSDDVISLVGPSFENDSRVKLIHADAFEYKPPKGVRFNAVWHDIWDFICSDNLSEMKRLHRKYGRRTDWQASWCRHECECSRW